MFWREKSFFFTMLKKPALKRIGLAAAALLALWLLLLSMQIVAAGRIVDPAAADVAIVLGAAVIDQRPSPVFEGRLQYAVELYRSGKVRKLLFTGGYGLGAAYAESEIGRDYAINRHVAAEDILIEKSSHTTQQNLSQARSLMQTNRLTTALVVSDPLHMRRALWICADLGIVASPAPTPTTRYVSWRTQLPFLLREVYFHHHYLATGD